MDELYENAETLGIDEKYPDFFQYLKKLQLEHDDHDERIPSADSADEEGAEIEETDIESEETVSLKDTVTKNLVEGHHTGKESFNEKNQKADELRQKLDEVGLHMRRNSSKPQSQKWLPMTLLYRRLQPF